MRTFLRNELSSPGIEFVSVLDASNPIILDVHVRNLDGPADGNTPRARSHVRQYVLFSECHRIMEELESRRGGRKFDSIVRVREDILILDSVKWRHEIRRMLKTKNISLIVPGYDSFEGLNDKIAFMRREAAYAILKMPITLYYLFPDRIWTQETRNSAGHINPENIASRFAELGEIKVHQVPWSVVSAKTIGKDRDTGSLYFRSEQQCWLSRFEPYISTATTTTTTLK